MPKRFKTNVLVVGGGLAGSSAAHELARNGIDVVIVDSRKTIGIPVQCAEFIPQQLMQKKFEEYFKDSIVQNIDNMITIEPDNKRVYSDSKGFMVDRAIFDANIFNQAIKSGAKALLKTIFLGFYDKKTAILKAQDDIYHVEFDYLVGADGPRSFVMEKAFFKKHELAVCAQKRCKLKEPLKDIVVVFREYIKGGYGWVFPKKEYANVGIGIDIFFNDNPRDVLEFFIKDMISIGLIEGECKDSSGGFLPLDGIDKLVSSNIALCGDAGGFCHPITGGGIPQAVVSGNMLARYILEEDLASFEEEAKEIYGITNEKAYKKRKKYMKDWNNIKYILPYIWVAYEDYWKNI
ncbi:geranylgeranyl reductase family protein [Hydrogenobaculum acidophilum]